jgi:hypothetical protein
VVREETFAGVESIYRDRAAALQSESRLVIGAFAKMTLNLGAVQTAADKAKFRNFGHAAARIRKDAAGSILPSDSPSSPGRPPHTRLKISKKGKRITGALERAIVFDVTKESAVIGPRATIVGQSGSAHELGGEYKGQIFPERSFMVPALDKNTDRFQADWEGSIGG